jgi:hypothetical protein
LTGFVAKSSNVLPQVLLFVALISCDTGVSIVNIEETTLLASDAVLLSIEPIRLSSEKNTNTVGGETSGCVFLGKDIIEGDTEDRQAIYDSILDGDEIVGTFHPTDGSSVKLVNGAYS